MSSPCIIIDARAMDTEGFMLRSLGDSLPVENVQELASKNLQHIPDRYIRPEVEFDAILADEKVKIPVIDMSELVGDHQPAQHDELAKLHTACKDWGFFQLVNHRVSKEIEKMKRVTEEFFKLPLGEKMAFAKPPSSVEGYGQHFVVSEGQKLDWGDMLFLFPRPVSHRDMRVWPTSPISFRSTLDEYSSAVHRVAIKLLGLMEKGLGINSEALTSVFEDCSQGLRFNYYPPCVAADKVVGLTPHSDATGLTLLVQVNEVQGLQIKKDGKWVPVKPLPDAFIINIGDVLEILTNGQYRSIEHRAVVNPEKERLSIAAFHCPKPSTMIAPLPDLVGDNEANYNSIRFEEYARISSARKLDGKSQLDLVKIK